MIICQNEDGTWGEYEEPYTTVDFKTEEDYKKFEEILNYYNNRTEHDNEVRNKAIDDLLEGANEMAIEVDTGTYTMKAIGIGLLEQIAEQLKKGAGE